MIHEFHEFRMILEYNKLETFEDALSKREKFQHAKLKKLALLIYFMRETDRGKIDIWTSLVE